MALVPAAKGTWELLLQVSLGPAVPNTALWVWCASDRLAYQQSTREARGLMAPLLGATPSRPPPLRFTPRGRRM